jgi:hypothetical protein
MRLRVRVPSLLPRVAAAALAVGAGTLPAEVVDVADNGFTVKLTVTVAAEPAKAFQALVDVGKWWDPAHTYSQDAANLSIDPKPQGCFCERLPGKGAVVHMTVVNLVPMWRHAHEPDTPAPADCAFISYTTHGGSAKSALEQQIQSATAISIGIIESVVPGFLRSGEAGSLLVVSRDKALRGPSASPGSQNLLVVYPYVNDASGARYICRRETSYSLTPEVGQGLILLVQQPDIRPGELLRPAAADVITVTSTGAVDFPSALRLPNDDSLRSIRFLEPWMREIVARGRKPAADSRWKEFRQ